MLGAQKGVVEGLVGRKGCSWLEKGGGDLKRGPGGSKWGAEVERGCKRVLVA